MNEQIDDVTFEEDWEFEGEEEYKYQNFTGVLEFFGYKIN